MIYADKQKEESPFVSVNTITRGRVLTPIELAYGIYRTPPYQAKEQTKQSRAPSAEIQEDAVSSQSSGQALPDNLQPKMEETLGMDFTAVRLHHDTPSATMADSLGAKAFTHGEDIYFNHGEYQPETTTGEQLLAHELTHVKQQKTIPGLQAKLRVPAERDRYEQEADTMAARVVSVPVSSQVEQGRETDRAFGAERSPITQSISGEVQLAKKEEKEGNNWFMNMLSNLLQNIPGYDLLTMVIGRDPVSGQEVKGDGAAYLAVLVGLIPGGHLLMKNLEEAKVITKAVNWFKAEFTKLDLSFAKIKDLFRQAWNSLSGWDLVNPSKAFEKIQHIFSAPIKRVMNFITAAGSKLMELVFEGGLTLANAPVQKVMAIVNKGKGVLQQIISDPIGFLKNLLQAIHGGLQNFLNKIGTYLQSGLAGWLFGTLSSAGIVLPEKLNLPGIFSLIAQILEVTWQTIKAKVVKVLGPKAEQVMELVEKGVAVVTDFITKGPIALYEMAVEFLGDLKTRFFDSVIDWVRNSVIVKGVQKLISMFNPVGAIVQAAITIGSTIKFFIDKAKQIATFANAVFDSVTEIAAGNLKKAVIAVEDSLAKALSPAIGSMANMVVIGGIVAKIKDVS